MVEGGQVEGMEVRGAGGLPHSYKSAKLRSLSELSEKPMLRKLPEN